MTHKNRKQLRDILNLMRDLRTLAEKTDSPHLHAQLQRTEDLAMAELFGELVVVDVSSETWHHEPQGETSHILKTLQNISQPAESRRSA